MTKSKLHFETPVQPLAITPVPPISELVARMGGTSFQARSLAQGVDIWTEMLRDEVTIFFGLAGAMVPAGMRQVMVYLIQNRLIDCLVSTGANLFHDLHETLGRPHLKCEANVDDRELAEAGVYRIYDVVALEAEFDKSENFIIDFTCSLPQDKAYTTREYLHLLGRRLAEVGRGEGILTSAAKAGVPVYCPAIGDSVYGTAMAAARVKNGNQVRIDIVRDVAEMIRLASLSKEPAVVMVGGGTPKNFIQQAVLCTSIFGRQLEGQKYAIQITTDSPQWGGLSGCTFEEARSWRKVAPKARAVTVYCDATIALPIIVSALAEKAGDIIRNRRKPKLPTAEEWNIP